MKKECINPKTLFDSRPYGFSQVVVAKPGNMVFISGQVAWGLANAGFLIEIEAQAVL